MEICTIGPPREYTEMLEKQKKCLQEFFYEKYKIDLNLDISPSGSVQFWPLFSFDFCLLSPFFYFFRHVSFFLTCLLFMTRLVLFCVLLLLFNMLKPITTSIISKQKYGRHQNQIC